MTRYFKTLRSNTTIDHLVFILQKPMLSTLLNIHRSRDLPRPSNLSFNLSAVIRASQPPREDPTRTKFSTLLNVGIAYLDRAISPLIWVQWLEPASLQEKIQQELVDHLSTILQSLLRQNIMFYHLIFSKKTINTYSKLEIRVVGREFLAFQWYLIVDDLYIRNLENSRLKPGFRDTISFCICVGR